MSLYNWDKKESDMEKYGERNQLNLHYKDSYYLPTVLHNCNINLNPKNINEFYKKVNIKDMESILNSFNFDSIKEIKKFEKKIKTKYEEINEKTRTSINFLINYGKIKYDNKNGYKITKKGWIEFEKYTEYENKLFKLKYIGNNKENDFCYNETKEGNIRNGIILLYNE